MIAEIITIGDELLIGQVIDTNSAWMAEKLNAIGIKVHQITSISDNRNHILGTLAEASQRASLILITGGLGPTKDDITKQTLCEYFSSKLVFSEIAYESVESLFRNRGMKVTELNKLQAMVPECCTVIPNENGTAPAMMFEKDGCTYISMPGVPFEMKAIMENYVLPDLQKKSETCIFHRTILTQGVGESFLAAQIEPWETALPKEIKLAYLPQPGIVRLRLTASGNNKDYLKSILQKAEEELLLSIPDYIFGYDNDTLEEIIGNHLKDMNSTLSTAESCTGGAIASLITSVAGSSAYYKGSVVAYSNEVKQKILSVPVDVLEQNGAVSKQVVEIMASNLRLLYDTDYAIAVSGIAGPAGGTIEKPVGTTWIAIATPEKIVAQKYLFGDHRGRNIRKASLMALHMLLKELKQK